METQSVEDLTRIIELQQEVATSELILADLMNLICSRTQELTSASGAVVEMVEGDEMVYKACTGSLHNALGTRLKLTTSLSGMSVESGEVLYCQDSEADSRVDREICRRVGARSMICVPLKHNQENIGVLKVVSPQVGLFTARDVSLLQLIANLLSASIAQANAHQTIQDSERKFRELISGASDGILISKDGYALEANISLCKMFGYDPSEVKGIWVLGLVADEYRQRSIKELQSQTTSSYESVGRKKDGSFFDIEILGKNLTINGETIRMSTIRDISDKKKIEKALRESEQRAREVALTKSEFLANMSHEIRTPLNGILGMTNLLIETELDEQQRNFLEIIKSSGDSLLSIVNDILDFSKIEARKLVIESISFELRPALEDIKQILSFSAAQKNLHVKIDIDPKIPKYVYGDPTRLRQILMNLLSNAIKFTTKGNVSIRVIPGPLVRFEVIDNGIGIPERALKDMFKPFTQVDSSTTRKFGGTGLGLSICKELVKAMKGKIGVESKENEGSTFWFELPLKPVEPLSPSSKKLPAVLIPMRKLRILIAEDNAVNSLIARKMLEKLGHSADLAGNGKEAISSLELSRYDVVLMDCQMPEMDGFEATKIIRSQNTDWRLVPIVAMTAHAMAGDRERCLEAGMDDYVSKPIKIEDLHSVLEKICSKLGND